jgi:hypothetical protein
MTFWRALRRAIVSEKASKGDGIMSRINSVHSALIDRRYRVILKASLLVGPVAVALAASGAHAASGRAALPGRGAPSRIDAPMAQYVLTTEERFLTVDPPSADTIIVGPSVPDVFIPDQHAFGAGAVARLDLNGDGIDDLAVAVPGAARPSGLDGVAVAAQRVSTVDRRQEFRPGGAVYVFFGNEDNDPRFRDAEGEVNEPGWGPADVVIFGAAGGHALGIGGIAVGDFNGDGYDDLATGTHLGSLNVPVEVDLGSAYIVFGGPAGELAQYIYIPDEGAQVTHRLSQARVIVDTGHRAGSDPLPQGVSNHTSYNGIPVVAPDVAIFADPNSVDDREGYTGFTEGESMRVLDFNDDGIDDLAIGAPYINAGELIAAGGVYVLFGSPAGIDPPDQSGTRRQLGHQGVINLADGIPGVLIVGDVNFKLLGHNGQISVGDFDGDGVADLMMAAPLGDTPFPDAFIMYGGSGYPYGGTVTVSWEGDHAGTRLFGRNYGEFFSSLSVKLPHAGMDFNGDGIDDPVLGNHTLERMDVPESPLLWAGAVFVLQGGSHLRGEEIELDVVLDTEGDLVSALSDDRILLAVVGADGDLETGRDIVTTADFNGDGHDDLVVGVPGSITDALEPSPHLGLAIIHGRMESGLIVEAGRALNAFGGTVLPDTFLTEPLDVSDRTPLGIASTATVAGDFDGDGLMDLAIATQRSGFVDVDDAGARRHEGAVYTLYGQDTPMPAVIDLENLTGEAPEPEIRAWYGRAGDRLNGGRRLAALDFHQDGVDDLVAFSYRTSVPLPDLDARNNTGVGFILSGDRPVAPIGAVVRSNHADDPLPRSHRTGRAVVDFNRGDSSSFTTVAINRDSGFITGAEPLAAVVWEVYTTRFAGGGNGLPGPNGNLTFKYLNRELHPDQNESGLTVLFGPSPSGPWTAISALPRAQVDKDLNLLHVYFPTPLIPPSKPGEDPVTPTVRVGRPIVGDGRGELPIVDEATTSVSQRQTNELVGYFIIGDPGNILAVDLVSFTASTEGIGHPVVLEWETAMEIDNAGFYIVRASKVAGAWTGGEPVTPTMIGAKGTAASYSFVDNKPMQGGETRAYLLLDVDVTGQRTSHGPAMVIVPASASSVREWALY